MYIFEKSSLLGKSDEAVVNVRPMKAIHSEPLTAFAWPLAQEEELQAILKEKRPEAGDSGEHP